MDSVVALLIILTPFLFYSYQCFPDNKVWETFLFTYTSKFYENVSTFVWVLNQKLIWLILMLIWYNTSNNWFKHAILVPIGMLFYQIIFLLDEEVKFIDQITLDKFMVIPLSVTICILLFIIRRKLAFYSEALDLKEQIEKDIKQIESEIAK
ncbi:hypothetical protein [Flavobacterium sp.]|uniref:hypothetical protein n=1 Tax=Flavobacterium sp. TaxID=239 RepID=UPI003752D1D5